METEMQAMKDEEPKQEIPFGIHQRRAIIAGAFGIGIGLPLVAIVSMPLSALPLVRWGVCYAVTGGLTGSLLGAVEAARRPALRLFGSGLISGVLSAVMEYGLLDLLPRTLGLAEQSLQLRIHMRGTLFFACVAILWGWVLGGRKSAVRMGLWSLLILCAGALVQLLVVWLRPGSGGDVAGIAEYIIVGALLGWAFGREYPLSAKHTTLVSRKMSRKQKLAIAGAFLGIPVVLCLGLTLPRLWRLSGTPQPVSSRELAPLPDMFPKIDRSPAAWLPGAGTLGTRDHLPVYNSSLRDPFQMDMRSYDLSALDLRGASRDLFYTTFNDQTVWPPPDRMPADFDWHKVMELGKNPGLGIRSLHDMGVTGRGVGIAIIDQPLLVDHHEYASQLRLYEEISIRSDTAAQMHGPAVASIAVGQTVGVAPGADLYYLAAFAFDQDEAFDSGEKTLDYSFYAEGIRRILAINAMLPPERRIRVISMSIGWSPNNRGYDDVMQATQEAIDSGLLVVTTSISATHGYHLCSLGREPYADPDIWSSYEPGIFLLADTATRLMTEIGVLQGNCLWVTMDSRTTASETGNEDYAFYRVGGMSWSVPYVSGVYALAAQVDPTITPAEFWSLGLRTGRTVGSEQTGIVGPIIDPQALIAALQTGQ